MKYRIGQVFTNHLGNKLTLTKSHITWIGPYSKWNALGTLNVLDTFKNLIKRNTNEKE